MKRHQPDRISLLRKPIIGHILSLFPTMKRHQPDRISLLPEPIIGHILSLLPLKQAVRTSVLSKHWRRLWTHTTHLNLDDGFLYPHCDPFYWAAVVDAIISSFTSASSPVVSCQLGWPRPFPFNDNVDIDRFLLSLVKSRIQKLEIRAPYTNLDLYTIPQCLLHSQTLTDLNIRRCKFPIPSHHSWNHLKTLYLQHVSFPYDGGDDLMARLISLCTQLQRLKFDGCVGVRNLRVCSTSLSYVRVWSSSPISISFEDTPHLMTAEIYIGDNDLEEYWEADDLIQLLTPPLPLPLEKLRLDLSLAPVLASHEKGAFKFPFSSFLNLKKLKIYIRLMHPAGVSFFACLLRSCPHLEQLRITIYGSFEEEPTAEIDVWDRYKFNCLTHHLTAVRIHCFKHCDEHIMGFIRYLLANTPLLEKMYLDFSPNQAPNTDVFLPLKKASPHAKITIVSTVS